jgi:prepilin-type processing-associated H-X9-DG protein
VLKAEFRSGFGEDSMAGVKERERPLWVTNPLSDEQDYNLLFCDGHVVLVKRNDSTRVMPPKLPGCIENCYYVSAHILAHGKTAIQGYPRPDTRWPCVAHDLLP